MEPFFFSALVQREDQAPLSPPPAAVHGVSDMIDRASAGGAGAAGSGSSAERRRWKEAGFPGSSLRFVVVVVDGLAVVAVVCFLL